MDRASDPRPSTGGPKAVIPPPATPVDIDLAQARDLLAKDQAALVDILPNLSQRSIKDLCLLVFHVIFMEDAGDARTVLAAIIKHRPEWINQKRLDAATTLMAATARNRPVLVKMLLDAGAGAQTHHKNTQGLRVLDIAAHLIAPPDQQEKMGDTLLKNGSFIAIDKDQALYHAAEEGSLGMVRSLIKHGAGFGVRKHWGSALAAACFLDETRYPSVQIVSTMLGTASARALIDHGWASGSGAPIHQAARGGNAAVIAALVRAGASLQTPEDPNPQALTMPMPLMTAASAMQPWAIAALLDAGADANAVDFNGANALHHLAGARAIAASPDIEMNCLHQLVRAGIDPFLVDNDGMTPLDIARQSPERLVLHDALQAMAWSAQLENTTANPCAAITAPSPRF